jgi:DNA adenine methylase Dam
MKPLVKYIGGKYNYGKKLDVLGLLPKEIDNYYEPFCGGAGMMCYLSNTRNLKKVYLNDLDTMLINLYRCIQDTEIEIFIQKYNNLEKTKETFNNCIELLNNFQENLQCALAYLFVKQNSYNSIISRYTNGNIKSYYSESNAKFKDYRLDNLLELFNVFKTKCIVSNIDFKELLPSNEYNSFVFLDPPYELDKITNYYYKVEIEQLLTQLFEYATILHSKKVRWMITYNDLENIREIFKDFVITSITKKCVHIGDVGRSLDITEIVITNYHPDTFELLEQN